MARRTAAWYKRDGWFRLIPPNRQLSSIAEFYFTKAEQMIRFANACGWVLRRIK